MNILCSSVTEPNHFVVVHCCLYSNTDFLTALYNPCQNWGFVGGLCSRLSTVYMYVTDELFSLQTLLWGRSSAASNWQRANTKPLSLPSGTTTGTKCILVSGACVLLHHLTMLVGDVSSLVWMVVSTWLWVHVLYIHVQFFPLRYSILVIVGLVLIA